MMPKDKPLRVLHSFPHRLGMSRICTTAWHEIDSVVAAGADMVVLAGDSVRPFSSPVRVETTLSRGRLRIPYRLLGTYRACALHDWLVARRLPSLADKMTMANSLELRVPLLDHVVLEFAASLPPDFKVRGRETKRILKATFAKSLPGEILKRKKAGFPVPYESWLRGELKKEVEDLLLSARCLSRGYFRKAKVRRLLAANARDGKFAKEVFCLLVLELWHRTFLDKA